MKRTTLLLFALFATLLAVVGALLPANIALASESTTYQVYAPNDAPKGYGTVQGRVGEGSLSDLPLDAAQGSKVTLVLTPDTNCRLTDFLLKDQSESSSIAYTPTEPSGGLDHTGSPSTLEFTMPDGNVTVRATFFEINPIPLWVGGTRVTESNKADVLSDGTVSYDSESKRLVLNGAHIGTTSIGNLSHWREKELYGDDTGTTNIFSKLDGTLTIELNGSNVIDSPADSGIFSKSDSETTPGLKITGTGTLTSEDKNRYGIRTASNGDNNVLIESGTINVRAVVDPSNTNDSSEGIAAKGTVTIAGGTVTAEGQGPESSGIAASKGVSITGGTVTAKASDTSSKCPISVSGEGGAITIANTHEVTTPTNGWAKENNIVYRNSYDEQDTHIAKGTVVVEPKKDRTITVADTTGGTVTASTQTANPASTAKRDDTVTVTAKPGDGNELKRIRVVDSAGKTVKESTTSPAEFTMPGSDVTVYAWFDDPTVTVEFGEEHAKFVSTHYSGKTGITVEGSKVKYTVPAGSTLGTACAKLVDHAYHLSIQERLDSGNNTLMVEGFELNPIEHYASEDEIMEERSAHHGDPVPAAGVTIYAQWAKPAGKVTATVTPLVCGTHVTIDHLSSSEQLRYSVPQVKATISEGGKAAQYAAQSYENSWFTTKNREIAAFSVQGGTGYYASFSLQASFGYFIDDIQNVSVTNGTDTKATAMDENYQAGTYSQRVDVVTMVTAEHDWDEWTQTKAPTCTAKGTEASTCKKCSEGGTRDVDPLGHDWGEPDYKWSSGNVEVTATRSCNREGCQVKETETVRTTSEVTKEPTATEAGTRRYTAAFSNEAFGTQTKDVEVPATGSAVSYAAETGAGSTWTKGSGDDLVVTFKRSADDDTTFQHFTGIQMDGKDVASDQYKAKAGSVVVTLPASYLETLSVGEHTLTAKFDDGSASTGLTVKASGSGDENGSNGTNGSNSSNGSNGSSGSSGSNGTDGTNGSNGSNGTSSTNRSSGTNGTSGSTGTTTRTTTTSTATPTTGDISCMALAAVLSGVALPCLAAAAYSRRR